MATRAECLTASFLKAFGYPNYGEFSNVPFKSACGLQMIDLRFV